MAAVNSAEKLPFKVGESVMAQWPGSSMMCPAKVINNAGSLYKVEFSDRTRHVLDPDKVAPLKASRGRPTKSSRSRSRGSGKSPSKKPRSRSKTRSRSPARTAKKKTTPTKPKSTPGSVKKERQQHNNVTPRSKVDMTDSGQESSSLSQEAFASSSKILFDDRSGLRERVITKANESSPKTRMSARVAALQTARVAGVVTPGLITEGIREPVEKVHIIPTKKFVASRSRHFLGPFGTFILTFATPVLIAAITLMCTKQSCSIKHYPAIPSRVADYFDINAMMIFYSWLAFQALLYALPVGRLVDGPLLKDGTRLKYRMNGVLSFLLSMAAVGSILFYYKTSADVVYRLLFPLTITAIVFSYVAAAALYLKSFWAHPHQLNLQCAPRNIFYDFFMGRELNPRLFGFELKMFLELRPGLLGWAALNLVFLWKDFHDNGGHLSPALVMSAGFQLLYVLDGLWFEEALLNTMDVTTEGLGFMLVFGDLAFVPFVFTLHSRFLLEHRQVLSWYCLAGIFALFVVGYLIFRASNLQKAEFRRNPCSPSIKHLQTISTGLPSKILVGGWWGWVRHPNYFGDLLMALAFCLPTGLNGVIPYAYFIYLFVMLLHRLARDNDFCRHKYGVAWDEYCSRVRYRVFKYIY